MPQYPEKMLIHACRLLFGAEVDLCREFLDYLQPAGVKAAYRSRAKQQHPDRFAGHPPEVRREQTARFQELERAYRLLNEYLAARGTAVRRDHGPAGRPPPPPRRPAESDYPHPRVPQVVLEFGRYLYHRGRITHRELTAAILWQWRQRPHLGDIACRWGWMSAGDVDAVLRQRGASGRFGARAVSLGYLNPLQVQVLLRYQRSLQSRLGQYFVQQGLLSAAEVERLAEELQAHNRGVAARRHAPGWPRNAWG